jgi:hypothetical protein
MATLGGFLKLGIPSRHGKLNPKMVHDDWMILGTHDLGNILDGGLEHEFYFSIQLGISSSQLTLTPSFFRGVETQPSNQIIINHHINNN